MKLTDFFDKVNDSSEMKGIAIDESGAIVRHLASDTSVFIPFGTIEKNTWSNLSDAITMKRDAHCLISMSRVVGYYSRIENWNASKLGELKDRQKGKYVFPEEESHA